MGKGIALQFKQAFPENFKAYEKACKASQVKPENPNPLQFGGHQLTCNYQNCTIFYVYG
jgi:hypothetical protein